MISIPWGVGATLWNGYGFQGQNYVAMLQRSKMGASFQYRNLILDI